jgi:uncharacterized membrane protein YfcA
VIELAPGELVGVAFAAGVAAFIRAYAGFGFALAGVPLLSRFMPPSEAVPLVLLLELFSGVQLVPSTWREIDREALKLLLPAALLTTPLGVALLAVVPEESMRIGISALVLIAAASLGAGFKLPGEPGGAAAVGIGLFAGVLNGSTAMCGPPILFYFLARGTPAAQTRASMLMFFLLAGLLALVSAILGGLMGPGAIAHCAVSLPALFLATVVGGRLFRRSADRTYRKVAIGLLALIGVASLARDLL